jgi:hypothetical protein
MPERERTPYGVERTAVRDPTLGVLRYNPDHEWWEGDLPGDVDAALYIDGPAGPGPEWLPQVRATVAAAQGLVDEAIEFAAGQLLAEHNERWNQEDEPLTAAGFARAVSLSSIALRQSGTVEIYLDDGDLFDGNAIVVTLDRDLVPSDAKIAEVDAG